MKDKDKISKKDKKTWEEYTKNPKDIIDKEEVFSKIINKKDINLIFMVLITQMQKLKLRRL